MKETINSWKFGWMYADILQMQIIENLHIFWKREITCDEPQVRNWNRTSQQYEM